MLTFSPAIEAEYVYAQSQRNLLVARFLCLANCCFLLSFVFWDYYIDPQSANSTLFKRGIAASFSLAIFFLSFLPRLHRFTFLLSYTSALISHLAQSIILISLNSGLLYGTTALTFFPLVLAVIPPPSSATLSISAFGFFVIPNVVMWLNRTDRFLWLNANIFLLATCLLFCVLGLLTDRARRQRFLLEKSLEKQANQDVLTGLANRRHFLDCANRVLALAQRHHRPLSLLLVDIDHFKRINDNYGHPIGDQAIIALAELIVRVVRHTDIMARFGGEEFAILLPETDRLGAECVAERLRKAVEEMVIPLGDSIIKYTVSVGVAARDSDTISIDQLIQRADSALYQAKHRGRNCVVIAKNGYD
ncbi:MAG: GGDEF domain-containing protein [Pseudanabaenaceae cyanobacterium SKYGB_i_bin29]|nr:GGDEF domain-containing protein [Pseudanabaenaceae cyanobacterium SKYG29]MDW8421299.1 GGDEF domain-containing protein [Pseudanabaenaceae cyanobacterium SKYGB_i_bin29]